MKKIFLLLISITVVAGLFSSPAIAFDPFSDRLCNQAQVNGGEKPAACNANGKDPITNSDGQEGIIAKATKLVGMAVGILSVLMIMLGGYTYITSSGDARKIEAAKKTIFAAIIGLIIAASAQLIVSFVLSRL